MTIWLKSMPRIGHEALGREVIESVIRLGIVGSNYGRTVQLPAFRADARCQVMALAGSDAGRTMELARSVNIAKAFGGWRALVEDDDIEAIAIATPPALQTEIAIRALELGKPVFAEKPLAADLAGARAMLRQAEKSGKPTMVDFNFTQVVAWLRAKEMLDEGAVGKLRHIALHWHVENRATQTRQRNWKTLGDGGGGVLGNFISHCLYNLEWFAGPIAGLSARIAGLPDDPTLETTVTMALQFTSGVPASLSMSCASFAGPGHRIEFFGEDGTLVLHNPSVDYMRGFALTVSRRAATLVRMPVSDALDTNFPDGRTAPVARLAKLWFDAIESGGTCKPSFAEGYRVQRLIDAARRSHSQGKWIDISADGIEQESAA
jgi:predicted dehydrogenase